MMKNKKVRKSLSLLACLSMMCALLLMCSGCGGGDKKALVGTWESSLDLTDMVNEQMEAGMGSDQELMQYFTIKDFSIKLALTFNEDDTYKLAVDEAAMGQSLDNILADFKEGATRYFEDLIADSGQEMTVDEALSAMGLTMDDFMDQLFSKEDMMSSLGEMESSGTFQAKGGMIYMTDGDGTGVEPYELEDSTLTLTGEGVDDGELVGLYRPNPELGMFSVLPDCSSGFGIPSMAPTFFKMDFSGVLSLNFLTIMFAFLFVDMFDTLGTLIGVASKADMLDQEGKLPKIKGALMADAVGTSLGAVFGTSTTTTFVESASGVAEGGRTGLTAVVSAALFGLALFLSPIFLAIPSFATAPALIVVGFLMITSITKIDFQDYTEALPCYISMIAMPFMYSISEGIAMGVISYVVINLLTGRAKEKKISLLMYVLAVLFVLKYILI